jgi:hypothetical protein
MSINDESTASHQFTASCTAYAPVWEKIYGPQATKYWMGGFFLIVGIFMMTLFGPMFGIHLRVPIRDPVIAWGFMGGLMILGCRSQTSMSCCR